MIPELELTEVDLLSVMIKVAASNFPVVFCPKVFRREDPLHQGCRGVGLLSHDAQERIDVRDEDLQVINARVAVVPPNLSLLGCGDAVQLLMIPILLSLLLLTIIFATVGVCHAVDFLFKVCVL